MGSGIIFNGGSTGGGNPFSLGVNLPQPIVIKKSGNKKGDPPSVFHYKNNYVEQFSSSMGNLSVYLPNARYSGYNNLGGQVSNNIYDQINTLNPHIFMFVWKRRYAGMGVGNNSSHRQNQPISNGFWSHCPNIEDSRIIPLYTNFGNMGDNSSPYSWANSYFGYINDVNSVSINARSEWSMNNSQNIVDLDRLNPFRFYSKKGPGLSMNVSEAFYNQSLDFFDASIDFTTFTKSRSRVNQNNQSMARGGSIWYNPRQSDFNIYLAFALVINNPENTNQYIVGPMSNPVKQSLVMGLNNSLIKIPKSFKYTV